MSGPTVVVRKRVIDREGHTCQWCGRGIWGNDYSLQHRRARGMGGTSRGDANEPQNLVLVCGSATTKCHGEIESRRRLAQARGFNLLQGQDPLEVLLVDHAGRTWFLDENGKRTEQVQW